MSEFSADRVIGGDLDREELKAFYQELRSKGEKLSFNGINGATGGYGVEPMTGEELVAVIQGGAAPENLGELKIKQSAAFPIKPPNDPTVLSDAGWAAIFPAKSQETPAIEEALTELLALRQGQAGDRFKIYKGGDGYRPGETKADFFKRHKIGGGPADPEQMPYYVLLIGSPDEIPYEFQYQLDVMRGVGRIHFDSLQDYANYAYSVMLAETGKIRLPRKASFFGVASPDDKATQLSSQHLIGPLFEKFQSMPPFVKWVEEGDTRRKLELEWGFDAFLAEQATKAQLSNLLGGDQTPALLFTASHGLEFPMGDPRQIPHQGALLCSDWPGPNAWRGEIPQDLYFAGDDIGGDAKVLGLIAFHFACFGAGTPRLDQFAKQAFKDEREVIAPSNFIGSLPKRLLSQGALAVIGHVERAWGYSFLSPGAGAQTGVFEGALVQLFSGDPVGWTTENMNMKYADLATELTTVLEELEYDPGYIDPYDLAQKWTAHNDSRSYVVIGDPAVRLPIAMPDETPTLRPGIGIVSIPSDGTVAAAAAPAAAPAIEPVDLLASETMVDYGLRDQMSDLSGSIKKFTSQLAEALGKAAADIATLEVKTYTTKDLGALANTDALDLDASAEPTLRALTRILFDGDLEVYVPEKEGGGVDQELWQIHLEAVHEAQSNRAQFLQAMAELATNLLKSLSP